jgi:hypothetical protein
MRAQASGTGRAAESKAEGGGRVHARGAAGCDPVDCQMIHHVCVWSPAAV